jgi:hypothetical protein
MCLSSTMGLEISHLFSFPERVVNLLDNEDLHSFQLKRD